MTHSTRVALGAPAELLPQARAHLQAGHDALARGLFRQVLRAEPDHAEALQALQALDARAAPAVSRPLDWGPLLAPRELDRSLAQLRAGDFAEGWRGYEARWRSPTHGLKPLAPGRPWLGETPLTGQRIVLLAEQGFGDAIQFARYAALVKAGGAREVSLVVPRTLLGLMRGVAGADRVLALGDPLPPYDLHCPLMSLPLAFGTRLDTIPAPLAYLRADPARVAHWAARLPAAGEGPRIGLVWSGNPRHTRDADRSIPLARLLTALPPNARCVSLQFDLRDDDRPVLAARPDILPLGTAVRHMADTAAIIASLDLVLSVDTAPAHLAAALGKPTWLLLPHLADWRWLEGRDDSPWYPTMRLFRQPRPQAWDEVLARVRTELARFMAPQPAVADEARHQLDAAIALVQRSDLGGAATALADLLDRHPHHTDAMNLLGVVESMRGRTADALRWLNHAIALHPSNAQALANRSQVRRLAGRLEEAVQDADAAIRIAPAFAAAHHNRGSALIAWGRAAEAEASFRHALRSNAGHAPALAGLAEALRRQHRPAEAAQALRDAVRADPADTNLLGLLGDLLSEAGALEEAIGAYEALLARDPNQAAACANVGALRCRLGEPLAALPWCARALVLDPGLAAAHAGHATASHMLGHSEAAVRSARQAIALDPEEAQAHFVLGLEQLAQGRFAEGWAEYEWRRRLPGADRNGLSLASPPWSGRESVAGQVVLLHAEQGFGDTLQFARYAPLVADRGARVVLMVQPALKTLLAGWPGVAQVVALGETVERFDHHGPLLSLPLAFGTVEATIPAMPGLASPPAVAQRWARRLPNGTKPRVGLVWAGNAAHHNDANRSVPLARLCDRLIDPLRGRIDFVSVQKDLRAQDLALLQARPEIRRFESELTDFAETAGLIERLDGVVAVDTAIAHLAAALGKPVWLLLPRVADWRWLTDRDDSPWYPTVRLFRQTTAGDWDAVLARAATALRAL